LFENFTHIAALLMSSLLFGGMLLFSASFAAFLFKSLPPLEASALIRKAFPSFYMFVAITALITASLALASSFYSAGILVLVGLSTIPTRQILMPAINTATDTKRKQRFLVLHSLSVFITLTHIVAVGFVIVDLAT